MAGPAGREPGGCAGGYACATRRACTRNDGLPERGRTRDRGRRQAGRDSYVAGRDADRPRCGRCVGDGRWTCTPFLEREAPFSAGWSIPNSARHANTLTGATAARWTKGGSSLRDCQLCTLCSLAPRRASSRRRDRRELLPLRGATSSSVTVAARARQDEPAGWRVRAAGTASLLVVDDRRRCRSGSSCNRGHGHARLRRGPSPACRRFARPAISRSAETAPVRRSAITAASDGGYAPVPPERNRSTFGSA